MAEQKEYIFGVADITIGEGADQIKFDGKDYLQADGGSLNLTPQFTEFTFADFGETVVERRLSGWEGTVTIVAGQEDAEILKLALASTEPITDVDGGEDGSMDARIGTKLVGRKVQIHPRILPENIKDRDWTIYNMASIEGFERDYNQEQGNVTITLTMMPREGFDASKPGNFFYRGAVDPNAEEDSGNDGETPNQ
ncbi:hypothetical protein BN997_01125 [Oceanobacillus oncorhynchi]|uniref:Phage major tail protein 2 n=1 Tax=Oceanobacillus oncorhynchi TaxID=545501 RepID=A0A0A1MNW3_9BACI|nr:hypothetical protein [Oceanobacillus oncorhynchi]CEI81307.1 hypothetical protein BN997_01125 [Oceanobacillus oncorhynchi]